MGTRVPGLDAGQSTDNSQVKKIVLMPELLDVTHQCRSTSSVAADQVVAG